MRAGTAPGIGTRGAEPRRRIVGVNRSRTGRVLKVAERSHVLFVWLQRRKNRAEFEIGARTAGSPLIHGGTVGGVVHDGAVGNIEKARAHLRCRGGLSQRGCS